jgi:methylmalonyl-CoA/ethylmalonyl-CoA epimerase
MGGATAGSLGITRVGQVAITVRDIARATAFYRDVLGLRHLFSAPPKMAFFDDGAGLRLLVGEGEPGQEGHGSGLLYYKVADIDAGHAHLTAHGVEVHTPPHLVAKLPDHELWLATYKDGEGNTFALMCERR